MEDYDPKHFRDLVAKLEETKDRIEKLRCGTMDEQDPVYHSYRRSMYDLVNQLLSIAKEGGLVGNRGFVSPEITRNLLLAGWTLDKVNKDYE